MKKSHLTRCDARPIVFLTSGTRGDVQPVIALAQGLQTAGKPVRIAAPPAFGEFVSSFGIPFTPVEGNPSELMLAPGGQSALTFDGQPWRSLRASLDFVERARPLYAQMLANAAEACRDASTLVIGLPTVWGTHLAEALQIPCIGAFLQPVTPTTAFPSPLIPFPHSFGRTYNRITYSLASLATWFPWKSIINNWRRKTGLKPLLSFDFHSHLDKTLYGFSKYAVPRPDDYLPKTHITGYWSLKTDHSSLVTDLSSPTQFITASTPPLYIGFGSPGVRKPDQTVQLVTEAVKRAGLRAVFSLPAGATAVEPTAFIFPLISPIPHEWLFPQMSSLVHHGGAGTTGAGLLAGIPALITPLAVDQFFWGQQVNALGVGPEPIPQRELSAERLMDGLIKFGEVGMRKKAENLSEKMKQERGVEAAVEEIIRF